MPEILAVNFSTSTFLDSSKATDPIFVGNCNYISFSVGSGIECTMKILWKINRDSSVSLNNGDSKTVPANGFNIIYTPVKARYAIFKVDNFMSSGSYLRMQAGYDE